MFIRYIHLMEFMLANTMNLLSWKSNSLDEVTHVKIHLVRCQVWSGLPPPLQFENIKWDCEPE